MLFRSGRVNITSGSSSTDATSYTTAGAPGAVWCEVSGSTLHVMYLTGTSVTGNVRAVKWATSGGAATGFQLVASSVTIPGLVTYFTSTGIVAWNSSLAPIRSPVVHFNGAKDGNRRAVRCWGSSINSP